MDNKQTALSAAAHLVQQHQYLYLIQLEDVTIERAMTPAQAARYSERYNRVVTPIGCTPLAPEGDFEAMYSLQAER